MVAEFLVKMDMDRQQRKSNPYMIVTTQIPPSYPPCTRSLHDLKPIPISAMKLETHHRGSKTLIRVLTPGDRINAALAVVEDQEGTGVLLQLYNLPEESEVPADYTLYPGRVGILKEPFFKATSAGAYSLRVDHVNDIVWLAPEDEKIPARWRQRLRAPNDSFKARMDGNKAIGTNQWAKAESL